MSIKVSVICFKSKVLSNGNHPLMLRITENKKRVMKSLGMYIRYILYLCHRLKQKR